MTTSGRSSEHSNAPDGGQKPDGEDHPIIAELKKAASAGKKTVALTGYRGGSGKKGVVRVYPDPELGTYIEIPENEILNLEKGKRPSGSDAGPSTFLINADAKIDVVHSETVEAAFLKGPICSKIPLKSCAHPDDPVTDVIQQVSQALGMNSLFGIPCTSFPCKTRHHGGL
jgi:hypothetical protein